MHFFVSSQSLVLTQPMHAVMPGRLALSAASSKHLHSIQTINDVNTIETNNLGSSFAFIVRL
jgi:hypothetical protein